MKLSQIILHFRQHVNHAGKKVLKNYGGYTVLVKPDALASAMYRVAIARCGKKDNFNKKVGKAIVEGRVNCSRRVVSTVHDREMVVAMLDKLNNKCHERYDTDFFKRLIGKLDETRT